MEITHILLVVSIICTIIICVLLVFYLKKNGKLQNELTEKRAGHETAMLQAIFDAIPDFIFCKDLDLKYTRCNKHMEDFFGVPEADLIGKDDADGLGVPAEMVRLCNESDMTILATGRLTVSEEFVPGADGSKILCETIKVPIVKNGEIVGLTGISRDVTERKAQEEAANAASKAKSEFMARMSHEMLTPMNVIMGNTQLIKIQNKTDKVNGYADNIDAASRDLLRIIQDVLDMSNMEFGIFKLERAVFSFDEMFDGVLKVVNRFLTQKQQRFTHIIDTSIPPRLAGDEKRLSQVIVNILLNAIKFTPENGEVSFKAAAFDEDNENVVLRIEIADNGIGMSQEQQNNIFEPFEQVDGSNTRQHGGIGLGLAFSKRVIEMMGGGIWVESEPDKGSKFTFTCKMGRN